MPLRNSNQFGDSVANRKARRIKLWLVLVFAAGALSLWLLAEGVVHQGTQSAAKPATAAQQIGQKDDGCSDHEIKTQPSQMEGLKTHRFGGVIVYEGKLRCQSDKQTLFITHRTFDDRLLGVRTKIGPEN
jgi:hypothetical protein